MNHVNVMIATHDRWKLLQGTLRSLAKQTHKDFSVHIIVDGNPVMIPEWLKAADVELIVLKKRVDVVAAYGAYTKTCQSGLLFNASDDLVFHRDCLSAAVSAMNQRFRKGKGVIGINQLQNGSPRGRKYAFTLMNRRYIDHFQDRIIFCPDYVHYCSDMENGFFAQQSHCFLFCASAKVDHIRVNDMTTQIGLKEYKKDRNIFKIRQERGLLWGRSFDLIRRKN